MTNNIDRYLSTLLAFTPNSKRKNRFGGDYVSLIHVPANGPEQVYTVAFNETSNLLTLARYREPVWSFLEDCELVGSEDASPEVNVLQSEVDPTHPAFEFIDLPLLLKCQDHLDGGAGLDYYMLMWQKDGNASVVDCWEPYGREDNSWITLIGSMEVLASQIEYSVTES